MNANQIVERQIVRKLVQSMAAAGFPPRTVWDGEAYQPATTVEQVLEAVFSVDDSTIHFGPPDHGVLIICGNGLDCISDYHCGSKKFDAVVTSVYDWIEAGMEA